MTQEIFGFSFFALVTEVVATYLDVVVRLHVSDNTSAPLVDLDRSKEVLDSSVVKLIYVKCLSSNYLNHNILQSIFDVIVSSSFLDHRLFLLSWCFYIQPLHFRSPMVHPRPLDLTTICLIDLEIIRGIWDTWCLYCISRPPPKGIKGHKSLHVSELP